jgi:hypothetical protein
MARVYTTRWFAVQDQIGPTGGVTVPADTLWVVRDVTFVSFGADPGDVFLVELEPEGVVEPLPIISVPCIAPGYSAHWEGRVAVLAGDSLHLSQDGSTAYSATVSGYTLSLP